jgi:hypothetical protein
MSRQAKKYKTLIQRSQEEVDKDQVKHYVDEAKLQIQFDRLETEKDLAKKRRELVEANSQVPFSPKKRVQIVSEIKALEAGLEELNNMEDELF